MQTYLWFRKGCSVLQWVFVAKEIVELEARGVYGGVLIKQRQYWPNNIPGNDIDKHFEGKEVGSVDCLEMKTYAGKSFKIH